MKKFKLAQPKTIEGAVGVAAAGKTSILAGGTDLVSLMKERLAEPDVVVNLKTIPGLDKIEIKGDHMVIGALVTLTQLGTSADAGKHFPALQMASIQSAQPQTRNVGTVGGNLCQRPKCWYYRDETYLCVRRGGAVCFAQEGENEYHAIFGNAQSAIVHPSSLAAPCIAHGAKFEISSPSGKRMVDAEEFFVTPEQDITRENILKDGEILTSVHMPMAMAGGSDYSEVREKQSFDYPLVGATARVAVDGGKVTSARIVLTAVAPTPMRRPDLEAMIEGKRVNKKLIKDVAEAAANGATPMAKNGYKVTLLKATVARALRGAAKA